MDQVVVEANNVSTNDDFPMLNLDKGQLDYNFHDDPFCQFVWDLKYRRHDETSIANTIDRVVKAIHPDCPTVQSILAELMYAGVFLPGGRILAGAGTGHDSTLMNCYVMGEIEDSLDGIMQALHESAITTKYGGGIGLNFGTIRPKGAKISTAPYGAGGPVSFMKMWDAMGHALEAGGNRRGGKMAVLPVDHPDILEFIYAKREKGVLSSFNISVGVTDFFMNAVKKDLDWDLWHWHPKHDGSSRVDPNNGTYIWQTVKARTLWDQITRSTYLHSEPGVLFLDRMNDTNNLYYRETITATNPCGEQPLPPYGACNLGSINLARLVNKPFTQLAHINTEALVHATKWGIIFLDNVLDHANYPLDKQYDEARKVRRIGLGITGLADMLAQLGIPFGSKEACQKTEEVMMLIAGAAYEASSDLAVGKGSFPDYRPREFQASKFFGRLAGPLQEKIKAQGIRNGVLLSIAPTGTISSVFGDVSSGCEPHFDHLTIRKIKVKDPNHNDVYKELKQYSYAVRLYARLGEISEDEAYRIISENDALYPTAQNLGVSDHLDMVAALQPWVDSAISKTINIPSDYSFEEFQGVYEEAYSLGCKGCTTYRPNEDMGAVLISGSKQKEVATQITHDKDNMVPHNTHRGYVLSGKTYKVKWPDLPSPIFVTINHDEDGPKEIFISSTNALNNEWTTATALLISKLLQAGVPLNEVAGHLKRIVLSTSTAFDNGRHYPSLVSRIGHLLEEHEIAGKTEVLTVKLDTTEIKDIVNKAIEQLAGRCSKCSSQNLQYKEGCFSCLDCGNSKCD